MRGGDVETLMSMKNSVGLLYHLEILQVQYGAIILSFLGALHWGFEVPHSLLSPLFPY